MKSIFCLVAGLWFMGSLPVQAQQLRVAYFGETVTHYGLKVAYEYPLISRVKMGNNARKEFLITPGLAVYHHPHNHVGVIFSPELAYQRTGPRGGVFEVSLSNSYLRYFLAGQTFEVGENGEFQRVSMAGRGAYLPTVSVGFGRDLAVRKNRSLAWYARLNLMQQRPYNASQLYRFGIECGIRKPLKRK
ncbi:hypothetical protein ACFQ4C_28295 [Larkinella insperata]|uniref:DUF3575 domain-containing protein n=1 Tax=Larkinella insperata TaxID=332158 RepID=A0ABW3QM04_9BACT|nr:hypothetical protein [Larkinella insperata]